MFKFLIVYLVIFYSLAIVGAIALKNYSKSHYSKVELEKMITTPSKLRDVTDNPCQYTLYGDPSEAGTHFVKINLACANGQKTVSTLSLLALPDAKFNTILNEYARILGYDPHLLDNWKCLVEDKLVTNKNMEVPDKAQINCIYAKN